MARWFFNDGIYEDIRLLRRRLLDMKVSANGILLKLLGVLLLVGAGLKGYQIVVEPVANSDIWSYRPFLIFVVEFELVLGLWLLSGLFKRAAWLVVLGCFCLFCCITLYKGISGAASCGCFGRVHVNPWVTLFVIDLPVVVLLSIFRPELKKNKLLNLMHWLKPLPRPLTCGSVFVLGVCSVSASAVFLTLNEPALITTSYEVLEPSEWPGQELPILEHIDIGEKLREGNWLILLYHYDCPGCAEAIPAYEQMARDLEGNEEFLQIALVAVPPYGEGPISQDAPCSLGKMDESKEWFVTTPATALLTDGRVRRAWEEEAPNFETIIQTMAVAVDNNMRSDESTSY